MKKLMWVLLFWLSASGAPGQRPTHSPVFRPSSQHSLNIGLPPVQPIPPLGIQTPFPPGSFSQGRRIGARRHSSGAFPSALPLYYDYGGVYPAAPNIIIVQPPPPAVVQALRMPAREPVRSEMHEYKTVAPGGPGPSQGEQPAFAIVLKDGSVHSAVAVWAQDDAVHYIDMHGAHRQVPADAIDRAATRAMNRQRGLDLRLSAIP